MHYVIRKGLTVAVEVLIDLLPREFLEKQAVVYINYVLIILSVFFCVTICSFFSQDKLTPLIWASYLGHADIVQLLLKPHSNPDSTTFKIDPDAEDKVRLFQRIQ